MLASLLRRHLRELGRGLIDVLLADPCPACGAEHHSGSGAPGLRLCAACASRLERRRPPYCERCGTPLSCAAAACPGDHRSYRGLARARAPLAYRGAGGDLVRRMKFQHDPGAAAFLIRELATAIDAWARGPGRRAVVLSVPLHRRKLAERGLDQAALLAAGLARSAGLPFLPRVLARTHPTLPQGDVRVTSRARNVADAFRVRRPRAVDGRLVVLVDDVRTSGATAGECSRVLQAAGARAIHLWTAVQA